MSIDEFVRNKNNAQQDSDRVDKEYKLAYKTVLESIKQKQVYVTQVNEQIKKAENHKIISLDKEYTFDTEKGVKVYLEEPFTVKTLPEQFLLEKKQITSKLVDRPVQASLDFENDLA